MRNETIESSSCGCQACPATGCNCGCRASGSTRGTQRSSRRALLGVASALILSAVVAGCAMHLGGEVPANLDYGQVRLSEQSVYRVSYRADSGADSAPIPINRMHSWTLHVETADGRPVSDATVQVDGDMPQHMHGLPTRPRVTRNLGNGDYLVEGVKFQMGGWWVMAFTVSAEGRSDVARFNLQLQG
jgi:hypothetical protein